MKYDKEIIKIFLSRITKSILLVSVLMLFSTVLVGGQNQHSKITILKGGSVFLPFNSYTKMENGIEYTDWTRLKILYFEESTSTPGTPEGTSYWKLSVRALTGAIIGDGSANDIPIDRVELLVAATNPGDLLAPINVYPLTTTDQVILTHGSNPTGTTIGVAPGTVYVGPNTEVQISYRVGNLGGAAPPATTNTMLGQDAGYFNLDLVFTLERE